MKADITELLIFFSELMPSSNEEQKIYWFRTTRKDQISIIFVASIYEESVGILVENNNGTNIARLDLEKCSEIKIVDAEKRCLEVLHANNKGRCFLSLFGESILSYAE